MVQMQLENGMYFMASLFKRHKCTKDTCMLQDPEISQSTSQKYVMWETKYACYTCATY